MTRRNKDVAAIRKLARDWSAGWNRSDAEGLLSLFTKDPVVMPQGLPAVVGKKAIGSLYRSFFRKYRVRGRGRVVEVGVSGRLGYFRNRYALTATPIAGGGSFKEEGKSVFIVRRQKDDSWKIARLIDNSDRESSAGG